MARNEMEIQDYISTLTSDSDKYVNIKELTERFVENDEIFGATDWTLEQILANFCMLKTVKLARKDTDSV